MHRSSISALLAAACLAVVLAAAWTGCGGINDAINNEVNKILTPSPGTTPTP